MRRIVGPLVLAAVTVAACATGPATGPAGPGTNGSGPSAPAPAGSESGTSGTSGTGVGPGSGTGVGPGSGSGTAGTGVGSGPAGTGVGAGPVTLRRAGGLAGRRESVTVAPGGAWTREAPGRRTRGTLTPAQRSTLTRLSTDPALAAESTRTPVSTPCADGYELSLSVGRTTVHWAECGLGDAGLPVAAGIARLLLESTG